MANDSDLENRPVAERFTGDKIIVVERGSPAPAISVDEHGHVAQEFGSHPHHLHRRIKKED